MGILGIENRTENFKTAKTFAPFLVDDSVSAEPKLRLAKKLGEPDSPDVTLFFYPVRDYLVSESGGKASGSQYDANVELIRGKAYRVYRKLFGPKGETCDLEGSVRKYWTDRDASKNINPQNYSAAPERKEKLFSNMRRTEVDIVLTTDKRVYIGEAKYESRFDSDGDNVLVHQLIRQYVVARVMVEIHPEWKGKEIIPFIVCETGTKKRIFDSLDSPNQNGRFLQVRFMIEEMKVLKPGNILTWKDIKDIAKGQ